MRVRIFKPSKSSMQSGRGGTATRWYIQPVLPSARMPDTVMGWTSAGDTLSGFKMSFTSAEAARNYATRMGWVIDTLKAHERVVTPRSYVDMFKQRTLSSAG